MSNERRKFLWTAALGAAGLSPLLQGARGDDKKDKQEGSEDDVSAPEDLMREHGVLNRTLLVYEEGLRRLHAKEDVGPELFMKAATLIRKFVEDYHEKDEEKFIFPEFEKRKKLTDLTTVLRKQHQAGRDVTDIVLRVAGGDAYTKPDGRKEMVDAVRAFIRMYRPHETREDTVLFPALRLMLSEKQMKEIAEQMEKSEQSVLGDQGFEKAVVEVAAIEKQYGIYDLNQFTPKTPDK
jgi:hemerythrin-like domain-containing protein